MLSEREGEGFELKRASDGHTRLDKAGARVLQEARCKAQSASKSSKKRASQTSATSERKKQACHKQADCKRSAFFSAKSRTEVQGPLPPPAREGTRSERRRSTARRCRCWTPSRLESAADEACHTWRQELAAARCSPRCRSRSTHACEVAGRPGPGRDLRRECGSRREPALPTAHRG